MRTSEVAEQGHRRLKDVMSTSAGVDPQGQCCESVEQYANRRVVDRRNRLVREILFKLSTRICGSASRSMKVR